MGNIEMSYCVVENGATFFLNTKLSRHKLNKKHNMKLGSRMQLSFRCLTMFKHCIFLTSLPLLLSIESEKHRIPFAYLTTVMVSIHIVVR